MPTLFVSDLHLSPERPDITARFRTLLEGEARKAEALYILGDLFEFWAGDDAASADDLETLDALGALRASGIPVYFMAGNRDFLITPAVLQRYGIKTLLDPTVVDLYGTRVVLLHGDSLCTDDVAYQRFRRVVHQRWLQRLFLRLPAKMRKDTVAKIRRRTAQSVAQKPMAIMDVNDDAVRACFRRFGVNTMIHGHTHRPATHTLDMDRRACRRIVLGDWFQQASVLRYDETGGHLETR